MNLNSDLIDDLLEWPITVSCHEMRTLSRLLGQLTVAELLDKGLNMTEARSVFTMYREVTLTLANVNEDCRSNRSPCDRRRASDDNTCMHYDGGWHNG